MSNSSSEEFLYNWQNMRPSNSGVRLSATREAHMLLSQGYTQSEALDVLLAKDYTIDLAESAVRQAQNAITQNDDSIMEFDPKTASAADIIRIAQATTIAAPKSSTPTTITAKVVPTSYEECVPVIEYSLRRLSAKEFIDRLVRSNNPIVPISERNAASWERMAEQAKQEIDNPHLFPTMEALSNLHSELQPFVADTLYNSVLAARNASSRTVVSALRQKGTASSFRVASQGNTNGPVHVNLADGSCTCPRYVESNFAEFGIACEHLVHVADQESPHERLARAIVND